MISILSSINRGRGKYVFFLWLLTLARGFAVSGATIGKMRNLKLLRHRNFKSEQLKEAQLFCIDHIENVLYFVTKELLVYKLSLDWKEVSVANIYSN